MSSAIHLVLLGRSQWSTKYKIQNSCFVPLTWFSFSTRSRPSGSHMGMYGLERTYPDSQSSFRTDRTFTFSHLNVRTYDLTPCPYVRSCSVAMSVCHLRCPCASKRPSIQSGTYVLTISCGAVALVAVELPYLGCTSVPRRLPQDSNTAGSILLSQPVGLGSGLG